MKTMIALLLLLLVSPVKATNSDPIGLDAVRIAVKYTPQTFWQRVGADTKEAAGKNFKTMVYVDYTGQPLRYGASSTIAAWRFLGLDPALTFTPDTSSKPLEFEIIMPIRIGRIPMGDDFELRDFVDWPRIEGWFDRLDVQPYLSQNLSTGKFTVGFAVGLNFE